MREVSGKISNTSRSSELRRATLRLVRLYESWNALAPEAGKKVDAATWRAELERLPD